QRGVAEQDEQEANTQRTAAEQRRGEALSRHLVAQALASRSDMSTARLWALEGLDRYESEEAWANLTELLQYAPQLVARHGLEELGVRRGPSSTRIVGLAVSHDGSTPAALFRRCGDE